MKKGTRKRLSMKIDHRQHLSVDIIDIGSKFVEPDVVAMHTKTAKDDCLYDVKIHNKAELKLVLALGVGSSLNRSTESLQEASQTMIGIWQAKRSKRGLQNHNTKKDGVRFPIPTSMMEDGNCAREML